MTLRPFEILFRLPAVDATAGQFTPDSKQAVFLSSVTRVNPQKVALSGVGAHIEQWRIADHIRTTFAEVPLKNCDTIALSPDARLAGCDDFQGTLRLIGLPSGEVLFERKRFASRDYLGTLRNPCYEVPGLPRATGAQDHVTLSPTCYAGDPGLAIFGFSPDSLFVIAEPVYEGSSIAWDVNHRKEMRLRGALSSLRKSSQREFSYALPFTFLAPGLVLLCKEQAGRNNPPTAGELVSFPSGVVLSKLDLPPQNSHELRLSPAADPNFVLARLSRIGAHSSALNVFYEPPSSSWAAAVQFRIGNEILTSHGIALDVLGEYYVAEPNPGEVGLYERGKGLQATVRLHQK